MIPRKISQRIEPVRLPSRGSAAVPSVCRLGRQYNGLNGGSPLLRIVSEKGLLSVARTRQVKHVIRIEGNRCLMNSSDDIARSVIDLCAQAAEGRRGEAPAVCLAQAAGLGDDRVSQQ